MVKVNFAESRKRAEEAGLLRGGTAVGLLPDVLRNQEQAALRLGRQAKAVLMSWHTLAPAQFH